MNTPGIDTKTRLNGWFKFIIASLITLGLSLGSTFFVVGQYSQKIDSQAAEIDNMKKDATWSTHLLIRIDERVQNIERILKEMQNK